MIFKVFVLLEGEYGRPIYGCDNGFRLFNTCIGSFFRISNKVKLYIIIHNFI